MPSDHINASPVLQHFLSQVYFQNFFIIKTAHLLTIFADMYIVLVSALNKALCTVLFNLLLLNNNDK